MTVGAGAVSSLPQAGVYWCGGDERWTPPPEVTPLTEAIHADLCIVGGGFTGLWTALYVKRLAPETDVVLLDQFVCGLGASGRNGGWVNGWQDALPSLVGLFGAERARWLLEQSVESVNEIARTVADGAIDCDFTLHGGVTVALSEAQMARFEEENAERERYGAAGYVELLDAEAARAACGSPRALGGVVLKTAGGVQPALLARGLRRLAVEAGVRVFEASPMTRLRRSTPAVVETPAGGVTAAKVVLCGGAWMAQVDELRRTVFVIPSHVVATAPSAAVLDGMGWQRGRPFSDGRTAVHYGQRTADDRLVFGRGGGQLGFAGRVIPAHFHDKANVESIVADLRQLFPASRDLAIEWRWGGPVERTQHGFPWVGTLGKGRNIHYGIGYGGNGVAPSNLIGRTLASVALERDDDHARSPLVSDPPSYLPPEPFRFVAARAMRSAIERYEVLEDEGRKPDPVSGFLRRGLGLSVPKGPDVSRLLHRDDE
ncbi:MAG: FAD-binding oxidoreductase [Thermoleophilia bacterium]|jgi:glycine/D-amino acid oxidase-like deaminating enzyme|nr:FAD-binding oxidoreductase [Thermoleophilia bacterium]